jgi:putative hemolysin
LATVLFYEPGIPRFDDDGRKVVCYAGVKFRRRRCNMSRGLRILVGVVGGLVLVVLIGVVVCTILSAPVRSTGPEAAANAEPGGAGMPNPAAVYCEEQGGTVDVRTDADGGQYGVCIFADGSECDEWAFYRGECGPGN